MKHTISFKSFSSNLGTRVLGQEIRKDIETQLSAGNFVEFNFEGVDFASHSFSDECFGKLLLLFSFEELKTRSTFVNTNVVIKKTIAMAIHDRLALANFQLDSSQ